MPDFRAQAELFDFVSSSPRNRRRYADQLVLKLPAIPFKAHIFC
jgi:hypothetical protein